VEYALANPNEEILSLQTFACHGIISVSAFTFNNMPGEAFGDDKAGLKDNEMAAF
jgi:hypothetical protein